MPLNTAQIATLAGLLFANRGDEWDRAGILAHVETLAADPRPWPELQQQAIGRSADMSQRTPKCLLDPLPVAPAPAPSVIREARAIYEPCKECGYAGPPRVDNGECVGCRQNRQATTVRPVSPAPVPRRSGPPPPEIKAAIEADFQARRAARARSEG